MLRCLETVRCGRSVWRVFVILRVCWWTVSAPVADEFISRSVAATSYVGTQDTLRLREPNRYDRVGGDAATRDVAKHQTGQQPFRSL